MSVKSFFIEDQFMTPYKEKKISAKGNKVKQEPKKRVVAENWSFEEKYYETPVQLSLLERNPEELSEEDKNIKKIITQQINKKISSYKQQDIMKKKYNAEYFLKYDSVINKMIECNLKCRYCTREMSILYDISREMTQWSVDRVDNDIGHTNDNFHLACLECNLKRRRRTDEKFLFTKQLKIIKSG